MKTTREPLYLLDLLKLSTLGAIVTLHTHEFIFFMDDLYWGTKAPLFFAGSLFARAQALGGQVLVMLIYLLFGLKDGMKRGLFKLSALALIGHITFALIFMGDSSFINAIEWDIYSYIFFTSFILALLPSGFIHSRFLLGFSFCMLWVSPSWLKMLLDENLFWRILTGHAYPESTGSWPLIPWFFHSFLFYQLGTFIREGKLDLKLWKKWETYLWPVFFLMALPQIGKYFWLPVGPNYYRFVFNQPPLTYWSNFLPFLFVARLSFLTGTQNKLREISFFRTLSSLKWCRNVGLLYIISVLYIGAGTLFSDFFKTHSVGYDLYYLSIMPVSEGIARVVHMFRKKRDKP